MSARRFGAASAALVCTLALTSAAAGPQSLAPTPVAGAVIDDRFAHLREPEAHATARGASTVTRVLDTKSYRDRPAAARRNGRR
jgi:hypothetical protein